MPVFSEEGLYPWHLEQVERLVAAELPARTRPQVAMNVRTAVYATVKAAATHHTGDTLRGGEKGVKVWGG